ncbi:hypothetical protein [Streptomyces sp. NPDC021212]|uniref:hypothetical protein n=1 Tax=Streptomyces sp. NPDC021212 TaxID=3365118 RepID=UPI0037B34ACA
MVSHLRHGDQTRNLAEAIDGPRGMLNAARRTYCRLLAASPGPSRALVIESVACPAIRKVRAECSRHGPS